MFPSVISKATRIHFPKMQLIKQSKGFIRKMLGRLPQLIAIYPLGAVEIIFLLGILISAAVMINHPPSLKYGETDSWWMISLNLIHGQGYSLCLDQYFPFCGPSNQATAMREPVPVLLFALVARIGNESLGAAVVFEAMVYLLTILAVYCLTREWAGARSAVMAAFLWAIYLPATELIPQVSGDLLAALFTTIGIFFALRARKTQRTLDWSYTGIGLGLAILSRSATLVIALLVIAGQTVESWHQYRDLRRAVRPAILLSGLILLTMAPWLMRNEVSLGRPIVGSSLIGYNLYRHNYMLNKSHYFRYVGPEEGYQAIKDLITRQPGLRGDENEAQMDLIYRTAALQIIKSHPVQYIQLSAYRFFPLWLDWGMAEAYGRPTNRYDVLIMFLQGILLSLAVLGTKKSVRLTWPLCGSILLMSLVYMAVDARLLYLMPVTPLVISLSAVGIDSLFRSGSANQ